MNHSDAAGDLSIGGLTAADREAWQRLFAGYNAFYGRTMTHDFFDRSWEEFRASVLHRGWTGSWGDRAFPASREHDVG